jgi:hypothetical protein
MTSIYTQCPTIFSSKKEDLLQTRHRREVVGEEGKHDRKQGILFMGSFQCFPLHALICTALYLRRNDFVREKRRENCTRFWWERPKERDHSEDQGVDGRMGS